MNIKRGDIYWIRKNPYRSLGEHAQRPERPAIIVSADSINRQNYAHEVVYLTTAPKEDTNTHCTIRSASKVSTALCEQVQTVSNEQIGNYIGTCTKAEMEAVNLCIMTSLALDIPCTKDQQAAEESPGKVTISLNEINELVLRTEAAKKEAEVVRGFYEDLLQKTLNLTSAR